MLYFKTDEEIGFLRESNLLVSKTLAEIARHIKPGITTLYLDKIAEEYIRDNSAIPAFLGYGGVYQKRDLTLHFKRVKGKAFYHKL